MPLAKTKIDAKPNIKTKLKASSIVKTTSKTTFKTNSNKEPKQPQISTPKKALDHDQIQECLL
jgi:hypothetical protein